MQKNSAGAKGTLSKESHSEVCFVKAGGKQR